MFDNLIKNIFSVMVKCINVIENFIFPKKDTFVKEL